MFIHDNVHHFSVSRRKSMYSFMLRIKACDNLLVQNVSLVPANPTLQYRVRYRPPYWVLRFRSYCLAMIKKKLNKNIFINIFGAHFDTISPFYCVMISLNNKTTFVIKKMCISLSAVDLLLSPKHVFASKHYCHFKIFLSLIHNI